MSTQPQQVQYQLIPQRFLLRRLLSNWSRNDFFLIAIAILCVIIAWQKAGLFVTLFTLVTATVLLYRRRDGFGRMYSEIYKDLYGSIVIEGILKGVLWSAEETGSPLARWIRNRRPAIPFKIVQLKATIDGVTERYAMLHQLDRPYDHLYIQADGGAFANLDIEAQTEAVNTLAHVTNTVMLRGDLKVGVTYLRVIGPYDPASVSEDLVGTMDPFIMDPDHFDLDQDTLDYIQDQRTNLNEIREEATRNGATKSWMLIVVTIKRTLSRKAIKRGNYSNKQLADLPIIELGRAFVEALNNASILELGNVKVLGMADLANLVRESWDTNPKTINAYHKARSQGLVPRTDDEIDAYREIYGDEGVDAYLQAWPSKIIEVSRKDKLTRFDDNYLSTFRIGQLPEKVRSDQFMALQYKGTRHGTWLRRGMVGEGISSKTETKRLVIGESALLNVQNAFTKGQIVQNPELAKKRRAASQQTEQISAQSVSQLFNNPWVLVASSLDDLVRARRDVKGMLESEGFGGRIVSPVAYQLDAVLTGCLGANRL